jgi:cytochrome c peroxidase
MRRFIVYVCIFFISVNANELVKPIPSMVDVNYKKAQLGKKLFFDTRLSKDNTIACVSCHDLSSGGADTTEVSFGVEGKAGNINSPTVFNSVYNIAQFWDGRAKNLKEQVEGPITNHVEMASNEKEIIAKLSADANYMKSFKTLYPEGISLNTLSDAIAEYEKTLITPNSKFDLYLKGQSTGLTQEEKDGYKLFKNLGCISCHNGVNLGSNMFQKFGIFTDYNDPANNLGRFNVTKNENDKYYFKVPTLRNIEKTAPYFHDGSAKTLEEAVKIMGYYQLGQNLTEEEIQKITSFLRTLTGELPKNR